MARKSPNFTRGNLRPDSEPPGRRNSTRQALETELRIVKSRVCIGHADLSLFEGQAKSETLEFLTCRDRHTGIIARITFCRGTSCLGRYLRSFDRSSGTRTFLFGRLRRFSRKISHRRLSLVHHRRNEESFPEDCRLRLHSF
jgi:hypothetical protein